MKTERLLISLMLCMHIAALSAHALETGAKAPDFQLPGIDGRFHSLDELRGEKATVVVFTCNHCPFAKAYESRIVALAAEVREQGVRLIAINSNSSVSHPADSFAAMKVRAKQSGFNFPYLRDRTQEAAAAYDAACTPHAFLFDADLRLRYEGAIDDNWKVADKVERRFLHEAIEHVVSGTELKKTSHPPRGCSIKWANPGETPQVVFTTASGPESVTPPSIGADLPDALVSDMSGRNVWLRERVLGSPTALIVVRGGWCPYCTKQLGALKEIEPELKKRGYKLVALSPDTPESMQKGLKEELPYELLCDLTMEGIHALGLAFRLDEKTRRKYVEYGLPLRSVPGRTDPVLPVPAVILTDAEGRVTYVYAEPNYRIRLDPQELLKAAK